jgi:proline iminopeptidase
VFFVLGRDDRHVPSGVAADYFETIAAPLKRLLWFEESAHNPPFEQPHRFVSVMTDQVLPLVK